MGGNTANLYTNGIEVVDGVTNVVQVVIPETPRQKVTRCFKQKAREAIRKAVRDVARANAVRAAKAVSVFDEE